MMHRTGPVRRADFCNEPEFNNAKFWPGRDYEHQAEVIAIRRLLEGKRFRRAVDAGGGYGGLTDAASLQFPDESVDLVTMIGVLHLPDPAAGVAELSRILRPGGLAVIEAPYLSHHPVPIARQLAEADLRLVRVLSISKLRPPAVKTVVPGRTMRVAQRALRQPPTRIRFEPRTFFLLEKTPGDGESLPAIAPLGPLASCRFVFGLECSSGPFQVPGPGGG
jgi:SAM-dependent methyltransferase